MSTSQTPNRNYTHPEKDEDLESSNAFMRLNLFAIDTDIQTLFNEKANSVDVFTKTESEALMDSKITTFSDNLDIYGSYTTGDVRGTTELNLIDVLATPGVATKVTVNSKGLVIGVGTLTKSDITDFSDADYLSSTIFGDDTATGTDKLLSASKILSLVNGVSSDQGNYVLLSSYTDIDVLNKIKNVDGDGSGLDSDKLDGQDGSFYLDYNNFSNIPTLFDGDYNSLTNLPTLFDGNYSSLAGAPTPIGNNIVASAPTVSFDLSVSVNHTVVMDQDISVSVVNLVDGQRGTLIFKQDSVGGYVPTLPASFKFAGGVSPTFSSSADSIDTIDYVVSGTDILCTFSANFS